MAQWNKNTQSFGPNNSSLFETVTLADNFGAMSDWRPSFTSKNRLKVSNPTTIFHHTFSHTLDDDDVWLQEVGGTAAAYINNDNPAPETFDWENPGIYSIQENTAVLRVSAPGDFVRRETAQVISYTPGKEQLFTMSVRFGDIIPEVTRRVGMYDDTNGFFFEDDGTGDYFLVIKKNGVETLRVGRNDWNGDKLLGDGRSQIIANPFAQQLLAIEYEWYGAGQVKFGYIIDGEFITIHTVKNANVTVGAWTRSAFLPVAAELIAGGGFTGDPAYFYLSSTAVQSEGSDKPDNRIHNYITGLNFTGSAPNVTISGTSLTNANQFYPLVSLKLKDIGLRAVVQLIELQVSTTDNADLFWVLVRNPTLTGATYAYTGDDSGVTLVDDTASALSFTTEDILLSGAVIGGSSNPMQLNSITRYQLRRQFVTNSFSALTSDVVTLAAASTVGNKGAVGSLTWAESV